MQVTVKDSELNVRAGSPSLNAPNNTYLTPGTVIEVDGQLYMGDSYEGINTWLRDAANNYYWSGGVVDNTDQGTLQTITTLNPVKYNYNNLISIPDQIRATKGEGVTIAIIDTGCSSHIALKGAITLGYDVFQKKENLYNDQSLNGHGTFISGIIAARGDGNSEIVGIAPLVNIISVKAIVDDEVYAENILAALNWILSLNTEQLPQIINMSLDFDPGDLVNDFEKIFQLISQKSITIIAAGQDEKEIYNTNIYYPARSGFVLGVGTINKENILTNPLNTQIDYVVPDLSFYSTANFNSTYTNLSGSSISSAIVSGAYALYLSFKEKNTSQGDLLSLINQDLPQFTLTNFDNTIKIFKR